MGLVHIFGFGHGAVVLDFLLMTDAPYTNDEIEEFCVPYLRADDEIENIMVELKRAGLVELSDTGWIVTDSEEIEMLKMISFNGTKG